MDGGDRPRDWGDRRDRYSDDGRRGREEFDRGRLHERDGRERRNDSAEPTRRLPPVCFGCKVPGHYRSDCWRFWADTASRKQAERDGYACPPEFDRRGRSISPKRSYGAPLHRSPSADSKTVSKLEELGERVATLKEFVELEKVRREEKEKKRLAREEARKKELEAVQREAEECVAEEARCLRKLEKQRRREEEQLAMTKAVEMQLAVRLSKIQEEIKSEVRKVVEKGKAKEEQPPLLERQVNLVRWKYARAEVSACICAGLPYPRVRGHVQFRLQELDGVPELLGNAKNFPKPARGDRLLSLRKEVEVAFDSCPNIKGQRVTCSMAELAVCVQDRSEVNGCLGQDVVREWGKALQGLVLTPLDRNPGVTMVMCPHLYFEGMMGLFIRSGGYSIVTDDASKVLLDMKDDLRDANLTDFARWNKKGSIGQAYVIPKQKDPNRFRPICPSFSEPTAKTSKAVAKALNHMLYTIPTDWHFNLKDVSQLAKKVEWCKHRMSRIAPEVVESRSYDRKDMFSLLPHAEFDFLQSLVYGIRLMDDVGVTVGGREDDDAERKAIFAAFENAYPRNLTLKRTDEGCNVWEFLGCEVRVNCEYPFIKCVQLSKNEATIWNTEILEILSGQSFNSWGSKAQKSAVICSYLHRIDRNTTVRSEIPRRVVTLKKELRLKDFPGKFFDRILRSFTHGRKEPWKWTCALAVLGPHHASRVGYSIRANLGD
ncbi:hypothetical protein CBR_g2918 [Chara braunii]|uniref:CCHC-type domain-containing protein n=1 Tax=Chara braunii TaxID=69332 RepID=A0A388KE89_CHABU|nr:hypothetical protein CBR_g2918 [Chara braunii]|eukprot:GBG68375.1 hypothetical protein CBR_g2918 [Chara braunii]